MKKKQDTNKPCTDKEESKVEKEESQQLQLPPSLKAQIISLDRVNENDLNFGHISTQLMRVMREMLPRLGDLAINEIMHLFRFESFIMLVMDDNAEKRLEAFKLFLELMERSSTMSFYFASVASAAGNAMVTAATTNPMMLMSSGSSSQHLAVNKENLVYAMANQLSRFDETDERFLQFCLSKLLCMEFNFKKPPDSQQLKSQTAYILGKQTYLYILVSLIYSARKALTLCRGGLCVLFELADLEIIRIDFLISRAGLIQMLINLLKFYSDPYCCVKSSNEELTAIVNDIKNFLCLIGRHLLRLNENQDLELFDYYINTLTYMCFNSANNCK